jgi:hypothetical protein
MNNVMRDISALGVVSIDDVTSERVLLCQALLSSAVCCYGLLIRRVSKCRSTTRKGASVKFYVLLQKCR